MTRWFRQSLSVSDPFVCRCLNISAMLRFHTPLVEPDVRISRIRLSDKDSRCRPRKVAGPRLEPYKPQRLFKIFVRVL